MSIYILYKTTNLINGRYYIGKHKCKSTEFDGYLGSGKILKMAISKYGKENFSRETLVVCDDPELIDLAEAMYVDAAFLIKNKGVCYNQAVGGYGGFCVDDFGVQINIAQLPSVREKLRISSLEVHNRPDVIARKRAANLGENNPMYGRELTAEHRNAISKSLVGRQVSRETSAKISAALTGRTVPECVGRKISTALKGRVVPEDQKRKMSAARIGIKLPDDVKAKISLAHIGMKYEQRTCPHCNLVGSGGNMTRYHFDNCKLKELT